MDVARCYTGWTLNINCLHNAWQTELETSSDGNQTNMSFLIPKLQFHGVKWWRIFGSDQAPLIIKGGCLILSLVPSLCPIIMVIWYHVNAHNDQIIPVVQKYTWFREYEQNCSYFWDIIWLPQHTFLWTIFIHIVASNIQLTRYNTCFYWAQKKILDENQVMYLPLKYSIGIPYLVSCFMRIKNNMSSSVTATVCPRQRSADIDLQTYMMCFRTANLKVHKRQSHYGCQWTLSMNLIQDQVLM